MTRIQRRIFSRGVLVGALLTITVIAIDFAGVLTVPESWLYDLRARHFQFSTPKPSDQLVHVDLDDHAVDAIGSWPWPRAKIAAMLDELRLAGVKAVAMDVLFSETREPQPLLERQEDGKDKVVGVIDNDAELAAAVKKLGCAIIPASLTFDAPNPSQVYRAIVEELRKDPEMEEAELTRRLGSTAFARPDLAHSVTDNFIEARKEALLRRITDEMRSAPCSQDELRTRLLKSKQANVSSPVSRAFDEQYARWESVAAIERFGADVGPTTPLLARVSVKLPPIPALAHAAAGSGFVDYSTDLDGVLRSVPLLVEHEGRIMPQVALSMAMLTLGVQMRDLVISDQSIVLPCPDGRRIEIPIYSQYSKTQGRSIAAVFDIPWFGGARWETMYDWPKHLQNRQHIGIAALSEPGETIRKIAKDNGNAEVALRQLRDILNLSPPINPTSRPAEDPEANVPAIDRMLSETSFYTEQYEKMKPQELDDAGRLILERVNVLRTVREEIQKLGAQLREQRTFLASQLSGKSVLIGWTATGFVDSTPSSLHAKIPGVIAHGVIFSSIMSGNFWKRAPLWMTTIITLVLGLVAAMLAGWFSPMLGLFLTALLGGGYVFVNGYYLFDQHHLIFGLAGPLLALFLAWAGCMVNRIIIETSERAHITRRFRNYVDPTLVAHVLENPDQVRLEGETRELTVVFTDLMGFTALSERLGDQIVPLLNEYMGLMVPIIRNRKGYVNKMLGDGIMFFFGAPVPGLDHAEAAVETVLEMRPAIEKFNEDLVRRRLPKIGMRAGITSGLMVVGDAGSPDAADYTVIGDTVNLAARLESANKVTGTHILISARVAELIGDRFTLRPVGKLQVAGKAEGVMTFEPLALATATADEQKNLARMTADMVNAFIASKFDECLAAADRLDSQFGPSDLTRLYREQCRRCLTQPPGPTFDGRIALTEK